MQFMRSLSSSSDMKSCIIFTPGKLEMLYMSLENSRDLLKHINPVNGMNLLAMYVSDATLLLSKPKANYQVLCLGQPYIRDVPIPEF